MKRIPIKVARDVAKANGLSQVILAAWDGERTHIVTYGTTVEHCAQAALGGNKIKAALGWPKDLIAEPSRVRALVTAGEQRESSLRHELNRAENNTKVAMEIATQHVKELAAMTAERDALKEVILYGRTENYAAGQDWCVAWLRKHAEGCCDRGGDIAQEVEIDRLSDLLEDAAKASR